MKRFLPLLAALLLVGCEPQTATEKVEVTPKVAPGTNQVEKVELFTITSKGTFKAGYNNEVREILIVKDNRTGVEYLAITDCALIRRVKEKEEAVSDALETAVDIATDIAFE
jgi:tellurite resistance protein